MKVLFLCPTMHRAGTWFRCYYLAVALARRGDEVTLVKVSPDRRVVPRVGWEEGVRLVEMPRFIGGRISHGGTRLPSDLVARALHVLMERYDTVHMFTHHFNAAIPGFLARVARGARLVADWDDLWTDGGLYGSRPVRGLFARLDYAIDAWSEKHLKRLARATVVVSHDLYRRSLDHGVAQDRLLLLPNGAAVDRIQPGPAAPARKALGLPLEPPILLFVGHVQMDLPIVIEALAHLQPDLRPLTVVLGARYEPLVELAEARGLGDQIEFRGFVPVQELYRYFVAADVGLLPYDDTPLNRARSPIKLGDYLAAGLPVLTCDVGDVGAFLQRWPVGVATGTDAAAYAEGLRELLTRADLPALSASARRAAESISWDRAAEDLASFYRRL